MSGAERIAGPRGQEGPALIDALGPHGRDQWVETCEQIWRADAAAGVDLAARLRHAPPSVRAAHERRQELLDALPLGDLSRKVCVDFGVGGHGFGCRFPRLQTCARAIGIDLSLAALRASAALPGAGPRHTYLTSRGDRIELPDASVDVVFAGDSVERVENADAFFEEAHRILKPGGLLVLTTVQAAPEAPCLPPAVPQPPAAPPPQLSEKQRSLIARLARLTPRRAFARLGRMVRANPSLRRIARFVKRRLVGPPPPPPPALPPVPALPEHPSGAPEHLGALTCAELRRFLALRFEILKAHGYGGPVGRSGVPGEDLTNRPDQARGVVVLARRREDYRRAAWTQQHHHHESPWIHYRGGPWEIIGLHGALTGRLTDDAAASSLTVDVEGSAVVLHFWATPCSGEAVVEVGGVRRAVNLYSPWPCFKRVHIDGLAPCRHQLRVSGSDRRDPRSGGTQLVFHQALAYHRGPAPARPAAAPAAPRRTPEEIEQLRRMVASRPWFHTVDLGDGIVTPGCDNSAGKVSYLGLPERLDGLSVLDVGAYDGYLSFECERRGAARVVAADHYCWTYGRSMATKDGFDICKAALGSRVEDVLIPVEEISPERVGTFDLVLFLGVLYHAPDMLRYLRMVRAVCRRQVILETEVDALDYPLPAAVFYPGDTLNHDASNNWGPNLACVEGMLREVGFRRVEQICTYNMCRRPGRPFHRAVFHAFV